MVLEFLSLIPPELQAGLIVVGKNIYGWLKTADADGKIESYEWRQLGVTLAKYGVSIAAIVTGGQAIGLDIGPEVAAGLTAIGDFIRGYFTGLVSKKK